MPSAVRASRPRRRRPLPRATRAAPTTAAATKAVATTAAAPDGGPPRPRPTRRADQGRRRGRRNHERRNQQGRNEQEGAGTGKATDDSIRRSSMTAADTTRQRSRSGAVGRGQRPAAGPRVRPGPKRSEDGQGRAGRQGRATTAGAGEPRIPDRPRPTRGGVGLLEQLTAPRGRPASVRGRRQRRVKPLRVGSPAPRPVRVRHDAGPAARCHRQDRHDPDRRRVRLCRRCGGTARPHRHPPGDPWRDLSTATARRWRSPSRATPSRPSRRCSSPTPNAWRWPTILADGLGPTVSAATIMTQLTDGKSPTSTWPAG